MVCASMMRFKVKTENQRPESAHNEALLLLPRLLKTPFFDNWVFRNSAPNRSSCESCAMQINRELLLDIFSHRRKKRAKKNIYNLKFFTFLASTLDSLSLSLLLGLIVEWIIDFDYIKQSSFLFFISGWSYSEVGSNWSESPMKF